MYFTSERKIKMNKNKNCAYTLHTILINIEKIIAYRQTLCIMHDYWHVTIAAKCKLTANFFIPLNNKF